MCQGGVVLPTIDVYAFVLDRYPEGTSVKIGLEFLVYFMVVLYVIDEYLSLKVCVCVVCGECARACDCITCAHLYVCLCMFKMKRCAFVCVREGVRTHIVTCMKCKFRELCILWCLGLWEL